MHPYAVDLMLEERQREVARMRRTARHPGLPAWRQRAGRALVAVGVALAVPASRRPSARRHARSVLGFEPPC